MAAIAVSGGGIVSMAPNITESIFFLGEDSLLAGRTLYCDYPKEAENIEITGTFIEMDYERIFLLNPDLVIFSGNMTSKERKFLDENKINYTDIKMERADEIIPSLLKLDSILSNSKHKAKIDSLQQEIYVGMSAESSKVFVEMSSKPLVSANKKSYAGSILELMGYSVFSDSNYSSYSSVSQENVISFNPAMIIVLHSESKVEERLGWQSINAVKNKRIVYMNREETDILSRPGPRIKEAVRILEEIREKNPL